MKKFLSVLLLIALVVSFAGCKGGSSGGEGYIGSKDSEFDENASENITLGTLSVDESVVKELLSAFSLQDLGLVQSVYDYVFAIKQATLNGKACIEAKAYLAGSDKVEGVFYIVGTECYKYDEAKGEYYLLTTSGAHKAEVIIEETMTAEGETESTTHQRTQDDVNDENTKVLRARYKNYDLSVAGVPKPIESYTFLATGQTVKTVNGETAFVIYLLENGQYTEFKFAMDTNGKDYYYDRENDEYKALK